MKRCSSEKRKSFVFYHTVSSVNLSDFCLSLSSGFENITTSSGNATVGICDAMDYVDSNDTIQIYVELQVSNDATTGSKTLSLNYEAVAV